MRKIIDLTSQRFERLLVLEYYGRNIHKQLMWKCLCQCGNIIIVKGNNLKENNTKSCGCFKKEITINRLKKHPIGLKHGLSCHPLYKVWHNMKDRCYNKENHRYKDWGGRGIKVYEEWLNNEKGYIEFYNWAKDKWSVRLELNRINNDGNYEPLNCNFVTPKENANNRRNNVKNRIL